MACKALYFYEEGRCYFRCAICRKHQLVEGNDSVGGVLVKLGNEIQAIVCLGVCFAEIRKRIDQAIPDALPMVDEQARLVG